MGNRLSPIFYTKLKNFISELGYPVNFFHIEEISYQDVEEKLKVKLNLPGKGSPDKIEFLVYITYLGNPDYFYVFYENSTFDEYDEGIFNFHMTYTPGEVEYNAFYVSTNETINFDSLQESLKQWIGHIVLLETSENFSLTNDEFAKFKDQLDGIDDEKLNEKFTYEEFRNIQDDLEKFKDRLEAEQQEFFNETKVEIENMIKNLNKIATNKTKKQWLNNFFLSCQNLMRKSPTATTLLVTSVMRGSSLQEIVYGTATGLLIDFFPDSKAKIKEIDMSNSDS